MYGRPPKIFLALHSLKGPPYIMTFYKICSYLSNCARVAPLGVKCMTNPNIFWVICMGATLRSGDTGKICSKKMLGLKKYWGSVIHLTPLGITPGQ